MCLQETREKEIKVLSWLRGKDGIVIFFKTQGFWLPFIHKFYALLCNNKFVMNSHLSQLQTIFKRSSKFTICMEKRIN
jgi:hypothetical protein